MQPQSRLDHAEERPLRGVELGTDRRAGHQHDGSAEQPADQGDRDAEETELGRVPRHQRRHVDGGGEPEERRPQRGGAAGHEESTPVHLPVEEEVGDGRPEDQPGRERHRERPEPVQRQLPDERPHAVQDEDLDQHGQQPECGEEATTDARLLLVPGGLVHPLHPARERDTGEAAGAARS